MDRGGQGAESLVGADVGGRFLAADVLFARGERQDEAAMACASVVWPGEAAGHLADDTSRAWR